MTTTNLNIRTDKEIKEQSEEIFEALGLTMSAAINMFLKAVIRENGLPFSVKLGIPNNVTKEAIEEGRRMVDDKESKGYSSITDFEKAIEEL